MVALGGCTDSSSLNAQVGPRPYYLIADMEPSDLKSRLESCAEGPFYATGFSIGHRGAPMQFPEHTRESYEAAARMGAGLLECDVTFTRDGELVCRHSQCDLHATTNILKTDLAARCSVPPDYAADMPFKDVKCCTSDLTLEEFKSLCGRMDANDSKAKNLHEYLDAMVDWRTGLYQACGTLLSHKESIELFKELGVGMIPELKAPLVAMPFDTDGDQKGDFSGEDYARKMIDDYRAAGVTPERVWAQSFDLDDLFNWIANDPEFGRQAVFLDGRYEDPAFDHRDPGTWQPGMEALVARGVNIIGPPMWMLLSVDGNGDIQATEYARRAREAGLKIITWTIERSGPLRSGGGWYYRTLNGTEDPGTGVIDSDGDLMEVLDALAREVGVLGIFSDWPGTVTYYANCMGR